MQSAIHKQDYENVLLTGTVNTIIEFADWFLPQLLLFYNVAAYHTIFFLKVITNRLIYTTTFISLMCEVSFHLMKSIFLLPYFKNKIIYATTFNSLMCEVSFHVMKMYFCSLIFKTTWFVTTEHGDVENTMSRWRLHSLNRNTLSLYRV